MSNSLPKAMHYARRKPYEGVVLKLKVDLGQCITLQHGDPLMRTWQQFYDSAFAPAGTALAEDENCVKNGKLRSQGGPFTIVDVIPTDTRKAEQAGYEVQRGRLVKPGVVSSLDGR